MSEFPGHIDPTELQARIEAYQSGQAGASDALVELLQGPVELNVARFLGDDDQDCDDVVQESLVATLSYLGKNREFRGDAIKLAVTIARNRCRDLLKGYKRRRSVDITPMSEWLADARISALDDIEAREQTALLQRALANLDKECRALLQSLYIEGLKPEALRRKLGLGTVQGVYQRRSVCLGKIKKLLQNRGKIVHGVVGSGGTTDQPNRENIS